MLYVMEPHWETPNQTDTTSLPQPNIRTLPGIFLLWLNMISILSSVCLICHAADCRDQAILKTRTRGGENERETTELRKERNKWDRGGGDGEETEREGA